MIDKKLAANYKKVSFQILFEEWKKFEGIAKENDFDATELLRIIIKEFLEKNDEELLQKKYRILLERKQELEDFLKNKFS
jgi:hypothetical protein